MERLSPNAATSTGLRSPGTLCPAKPGGRRPLISGSTCWTSAVVRPISRGRGLVGLPCPGGLTTRRRVTLCRESRTRGNAIVSNPDLYTLPFRPAVRVAIASGVLQTHRTFGGRLMGWPPAAHGGRITSTSLVMLARSFPSQGVVSPPHDALGARDAVRHRAPGGAALAPSQSVGRPRSGRREMAEALASGGELRRGLSAVAFPAGRLGHPRHVRLVRSQVRRRADAGDPSRLDGGGGRAAPACASAC